MLRLWFEKSKPGIVREVLQSGRTAFEGEELCTESKIEGEVFVEDGDKEGSRELGGCRVMGCVRMIFGGDAAPLPD